MRSVPLIRLIAWAGALSLAPVVAASVEDSPSPERPNVLLIVADDLGYQDLGAMGGEDVRTPHLDRLAVEGARLTEFYVAWPACTPSRVSLLTGRYPQRHGTYDLFRNDRVDDGYLYSAAEYAISPENVLGTDLREVFLSRPLERAGYRNGCFGKWDSGQLRRFLPLQRGFRDFYGFTNTGIDYFTHERYGIPSMRRGNERTTEDRGVYATTLFEREALRFLEENHEQPFFLYVAFNAPHSASNLDPEIRSTVQAPDEYVGLYPEPDTRRGRRRRSYMAAVTCMDAAIGRILAALEEHGIARNTLVLFLSDNGGGGIADNGPLRGGKARLFEGGVRVPFLARWPGRLPEGAVSGEFLTALEVFPTVLAATGVEPPEGVVLDGFDMLPVLRGDRPSPRKEMFWERRGDRAARVGRWKWVDSARGGGLFDLEEDPGEKRDLSREKPEVLERVRGRFAAWRRAMEEAEPRGPFRDY